MKAIQLISQDLFDKVRSRFQNLEMGISTLALYIAGILWFNDRIAEKFPTVVRNYTTKSSTTEQTTKQTVLPANIDHLLVKIKKILNISRDFIEISEYIDN